MPEDRWSIRIEAARDAQSRSRYAFIACTVISVALLMAAFNFEFSWLRSFAFPVPADGAVERTAQGAGSSPAQIVERELRMEARKLWFDSSRVNISLLGVDLEQSDASLLGSFSLYVLTTWFFYCLRRENHLIGNLIVDADQSDDNNLRLMVYHGVASYTVFTTIGGDDPIRSVRPPAARFTNPIRVRPINLALFFLPPFTIFVMIALDVASLLQASPLRDPTKPLWTLLSVGDFVQIAAIEGVAIFILAFSISRCIEILKFEHATESILRQFDSILFPRLT